MSDHRKPTNQEVMRKCTQLRRESGALLVISIRPEDVSFSADPDLAPKDAGELLDGEISNLVEAIAAQRKDVNHAHTEHN